MGKKKKGIGKKTKTTLKILWGIVLIEAVVIGMIFLFGQINNRVRGTFTEEEEAVTGEPAAEQEAEKTVGACVLTSVEKTGDSEMRVTFDAAENATGYEVSYRETEGEWITELTANTNFTFQTEPGTEYEIRVRAYGESGQYGEYSETVNASMDAIAPILTLADANELQLRVTWTESRPGDTYRVSYRKAGAKEWNTVDVSGTELLLGNLVTATEYEIMVTAFTDGKEAMSSEIVSGTTEGSEYVDPFLGLYGTLKAGGETKGVCYSDSDGCLGAQVWPEYDTKLFTKADRSDSGTEIAGGSAFTVAKNADGYYVCRRSENDWSLYVTGTSDGKSVSGWVQASAMLIDLEDIFPGTSQYSIHYNRTNAYSSIFTAGGNCMSVDSTSAEDTRWDPLNAKTDKESLAAGGYNVIDGVTGKKLPNYGSKDQMPVVWDMARELIICQKNALANGTCLLIYESYRPNSTSKTVYNAVTKNSYLRTEVNGHTFANGFFTTVSYGESNYIANNSKHNKGIALDLTIMAYKSVEELGEEISMQTKMHTLDYRCNMSFNTESANLLATIMETNTGLVPLKGKQEWWHFELGSDSGRYPCINQYIFTDYEI